MQTVWGSRYPKITALCRLGTGKCPSFATLLWYDYLIQTQNNTIKDESVRQRALEIVKRTIQEAGPAGLSSTDLCHILKWEAPFYFGEVEAGLDRLKEIATRWIETQEEDGSWCFHPTTDRIKTLGNEGDARFRNLCAYRPDAAQTRSCDRRCRIVGGGTEGTKFHEEL